MCYYYHPFNTALYFMFSGTGFFPEWTNSLQYGTQVPEFVLRTHWLTQTTYFVVELYCVVMYGLIHYLVLEPVAQILCYMGLAPCFEGSFPFVAPSQLVWNLSSIDSPEECESALVMHLIWNLIRITCFYLTVVLVMHGYRHNFTPPLKPE